MTDRQYCLVLDLKNDAALIREYERFHQPGNVFPEVLQSIRDSGIIAMNIYRYETRLIMVMDVDESFSFDTKSIADQENPKVQEWEKLMDKFQKKLSSNTNEKWLLATEIFNLEQH